MDANDVQRDFFGCFLTKFPQATRVFVCVCLRLGGHENPSNVCYCVRFYC